MEPCDLECGERFFTGKRLCRHGRTVDQSLASLLNVPHFLCPRCHRISFNPTDVAERYCGACHVFFNEVSPMTEVEDADVAAAMRRYGGGFVSKLGELWQHGDPINRGLIKLTWAAYWARYRSMAEIQKREAPSDQA